ncbi:hypothetical protein HDV01_006916 [Terramyces sp. JEL0728]|nr:hypothetical protein HDV01_006916 [Terramyces sp. JEL0728]
MDLSPRTKHHFINGTPEINMVPKHAYTPSIQPSQLYSPEILKDAIESLGRLEIDKEHESFVKWLSSKQYPKEKIRKPAKLLTVERLAELTEEELDTLIKQLQKNQNTYERWLKAKNEIKREQEGKRKKELQKQQEKETQRQEQQEKREKIIHEKFKQWSLSKRLDHLIEDQIQEKEKLKQEFVQKTKKQLNQEAFYNWMESKKHASPAPPPPSIVKPWVQDPIKTRKCNESTLSPPNLYNDYKIYKEKCPEYFKKYGLLVASAGNEPCMEEPVKKVVVKKKTVERPLFVVRKK